VPAFYGAGLDLLMASSARSTAVTSTASMVSMAGDQLQPADFNDALSSPVDVSLGVEVVEDGARVLGEEYVSVFPRPITM